MRRPWLAALICLGISSLFGSRALADTQWALNNVVTQSGGTITGTFDLATYTDPSNLFNFQVAITGVNLTYTAGPNNPQLTNGTTVVFTPANYPAIFPEVYTANYDPQNLPFPPPGTTSFMNLYSAQGPNPPSIIGGNSLIQLDIPIPFLPDLGPGSNSVGQLLCTTANLTSVALCGQLGASGFQTNGATSTSALISDPVDPGTITGAYIPGTPFLGGTGSVPEPSSLLLLGTGLVGMLGALKRRLIA